MRTPAYRIAATLITTATIRGIIFAGYMEVANLPICQFHIQFLYNKKRTSSLRIEERNTAFFFYRLGPAEIRSQALIRAEVAIVLMAMTILETVGLNTVRTSQQLLAGDTGRDNDSFAPVLEVRNCLSNLLHLGLLHPVGPELEGNLDNVGSPVHRLVPVLLHRVGAGELVAEPRSQ
jgi:hypothetical protein